MEPAVRTPDELETLLEDAFVTRDRAALSELFEDHAVVVLPTAEAAGEEARGRAAIVKLVAGMWDRSETYIADPGLIVQAREIALVVGPAGAAVLRRGGDGGWRYAIALLPSADRDTRSPDAPPVSAGPPVRERDRR